MVRVLETSETPIDSGILNFEIKGDIVQHLSIGLYRNFPRAIKELVSNAYDAEATEVRIGLDFEKRKLIIRDNGKGMNFEELQYLIAIGRTTTPTDALDELGRKRIGTFGIGMLSVFPYADTMRVFTKKRKEKTRNELTINLNQFFEDVKFDLTKASATYTIWESDLELDKGETMIVLENVKEHILSELARSRGGVSSIEDESGLEKFKWYLGQYSPLSFHPDQRELRDFFMDDAVVPLRLWIQGEEIFRNVPKDVIILEKGTENFDGVSIKYVIMSPMRVIMPKESRGLQIRLRNMGIGLPRDFDVIKLTSNVSGKLNWICGEVQIKQGLDESLMIDRDDFFYTEEVVSLNVFFRKRLTFWNRRLEDEAKKAKSIYELANRFKNLNTAVNELKDKGLISVDIAQLRIPKKSIVKRKNDKIAPIIDTLKNSLIEVTGYNVEISNKKSEKMIEINEEENTIVIFDDHPDFTETIIYDEQTYYIKYEKWDINSTPSICRLNGNIVEFNTIHPLFTTKLNNEIIKILSLGTIIILKDIKNKKYIAQIENLLKSSFMI